MALISLSVDWEIQLSRNLRLFADSLKNMEWFYREALDIFEDRKKEIFSGKWASTSSGAWKALAPSTEKARERGRWYYRRSPSRPSMLRRTGNLEDSIATTVTSSYWIWEMKAPYAAFHQRWWWYLPKRMVFDIASSTKTTIVKALQKKINADLKIFGLQA